MKKMILTLGRLNGTKQQEKPQYQKELKLLNGVNKVDYRKMEVAK